MVELRHNLIVRAFGECLRANELPPQAVVLNAINKLLHLDYNALKSGRDQRRMSLRVSVDDQDTRIGYIGAAQQLHHAKRDVGGRYRFPDTSFVIGENERTSRSESHCRFPLRTRRTVDFAVAGKAGV